MAVRRPAGCLVVVVGLAASLGIYVLVGSEARPVLGYDTTDGRALVLYVWSGRREWCRATQVAETATEVHVQVSCLTVPPLNAVPAVLRKTDISVQLASALVDRMVRDADGSVIASGWAPGRP